MVLFSTINFVFYYLFEFRLLILSMFSSMVFELVLTGSISSTGFILDFHYWFYFPLLVLFSTTLGFRPLVLFSSTGFIFHYYFGFLLPSPACFIRPFLNPYTSDLFLLVVMYC